MKVMIEVSFFAAADSCNTCNTVYDLLPLLLTWFNVNPSMDKQLHPLQTVGWKYLSIPKLQWLHRWSLGMDE